MIVTQSTTTMSPKEALVACLKDVAKRAAAFVLLFRSPEDDKPTFHGMIRFDFLKKCLELVLDSDDRDVKTLITWGSNGSREDYAECLRGVWWFCSMHGGSLWREQFVADRCDEILQKMMEAWNQVHAFPVLSKVGYEE